MRGFVATLLAGAAVMLSGPARAQMGSEGKPSKSNLYFDSGSAELSPEARAELDAIVIWADENPDAMVIIAGHPDQAATDSALEGRQARTAERYLTQQGVDPMRIQVLAPDQEVPASAHGDHVVYLAEAAKPAPAPETRIIEPQKEPRSTVIIREEEAKERPEHLRTPAGASLSVGGGVMNFIDDDTRDFTDTAGMWDVRFTYGTRSVLGVEAAYVGSAQDVNALGLDTGATLIGSAGEAAARLSVPLAQLRPYVFGGVGFTRYDIVNEDFNTSAVDDEETVFHIPLGVGVGVGMGRFLFDVRGTYRPMFDDDLIRGGANAELDTWSVNAALGAEF